MPASRNGVYRDLAESPFTSSVRASGQEVVFHFATYRHREKFESTWRVAAEKLTRQVSERCGVRVDMTLPACLRCYSDAETFSFYVTVDGDPIWQKASLESDGPALKTRGCGGPSEATTAP